MMFRQTLLASAALAVLFVPPTAEAQETELQAMQRQLDAMKAELAELKAQQAGAATAADVDATIERVMEDAHRRSQLLQLQGFTAGWSRDRFVLQSEDGAFSLKPGFQVQVRHVLNARDTDDDWETDHGFEMRRTKFSFDGNFISRDLTYFILWATSSNGGDVFLEHAWINYALTDAWGVRAGQMGNPIIKEQAVSSRRSLAVDRSLTNVLITDSNEAQTQAITVNYRRKPLFLEIGYGNGFVSANTDWTTPGDWNAFVRADYIAFGERGQTIDFSAMRNKEALLDIGGGVDITDGPDAVYYRHTADVQYEDAGRLGLYAAYLGNYQETYGGGSLYDWGVVAQMGYLVTDRLELFGRYGISQLDQAVAFAGGDQDSFQEFTLGANYYFHGHSAKLTLDVTYLPDGSPSDQKGLGFLRGDEEQFVFRSQFQLLI